MEAVFFVKFMMWKNNLTVINFYNMHTFIYVYIEIEKNSLGILILYNNKIINFKNNFNATVLEQIKRPI